MSNLDAMGMGYYSPGQNAFQACVPRATIAGECRPPRKRGPKSKLQQSIDAMSSFEERQAVREAKILTDNTASPFCAAIATPEQSDRTRALRGRALV